LTKKYYATSKNGAFSSTVVKIEKELRKEELKKKIEE